MKLFGRISKAIVGAVSAIAAVISSGCVRQEEVKCYYGPAPAPDKVEEAPAPELVPKAADIEEEPTDVYGPPSFFGGPEEPVEEDPEPALPEPELTDGDEAVPKLEDGDPGRVVAYYGVQPVEVKPRKKGGKKDEAVIEPQPLPRDVGVAKPLYGVQPVKPEIR